MIISRIHALAAIRRGDAAEMGITDYDGQPMVIVDRYDHQRVDHYHPTDDDLDRLGSTGERSSNPMA
ncbi:MAG: hypothetical protein AAF805_00045 [Planctomycetota bacterium]